MATKERARQATPGTALNDNRSIAPLYTAGEAAVILNLSERTVTRYAPQLGGKKFGRVWRFPPEEIERVRCEGIQPSGPGRPRGRTYQQ